MNIKLKPFFILGFLFVLVFVSCGRNNPDGEYIDVSLSFGGEVTVNIEPLGKAGTPTNDLYGINVYYDKNKDGNINTAYGYGLFDNIPDMTISLLSGYKYKFECTLVKDGKTKLQSSNVGKYEAPFGQLLENKFTLGTTAVMGGIKSGSSRLKGESSDTETPKLDRYYGEITNYVPSKGGRVTINLVRTVFGAKFVVTGLVNDGTLTASCAKDGFSDSEKYWSLTTTENFEGNTIIYTFPDVYACWQNKDSYTLNGTVSIKYDSNRGDWWDISKHQTVTWKRNTLTTVTISVSPDFSGGTFTFNEEQMDSDNVIDLGINGDGLIDVNVDPNV